MAPLLRIASITIQPVLILDDGRDISPGPVTNPVSVPLSDLAGSSFHALLLAELAKMNAPEPASAVPPNRAARRATPTPKPKP